MKSIAIIVAITVSIIFGLNGLANTIKHADAEQKAQQHVEVILNAV